MNKIKRKNSIIFHLNDEEKAKLDADANSMGMTRSAYIRWLVMTQEKQSFERKE